MKKGLFLQDTAPEILLALRRNKLKEFGKHDLARQIERNKSYTTKKTQKLEEQGYIKTKKNGRKQILKLTEKGEKTAEHLQQLINVTEQ